MKQLIIIVLNISLVNLLGCGARSDSEDLVNAVLIESQQTNGTLITSLQIKGTGVRIRVGETYQLAALGTDLNGDTTDVSNQVEWTSSEPTIATVSNTGLVTAIANKESNQGFVEFMATALNNVTATGSISINNAEVTSLEITQLYPDNNTTYTCIDTKFEAIATYTDGITSTVTSRANWHLSGSQSATIDTFGVLHTFEGSPENLIIRAELYNANEEINVITDPSQINSLFIYKDEEQINSLTLQVGQRGALNSFAVFNAGAEISTTEITYNTDWQASAPTLLGLTNEGDNKGKFLALKNGDLLIDAMCSGKSNFVTIKVEGNDQIESLTINDNEAIISIARGEHVDLKLFAKYKDENSSVNVTEFGQWDLDSSSIHIAEKVDVGTSDTAYRVKAGTENTGDTVVKVVFDEQIKLVTIRTTN